MLRQSQAEYEGFKHEIRRYEEEVEFINRLVGKAFVVCTYNRNLRLGVRFLYWELCRQVFQKEPLIAFCDLPTGLRSMSALFIRYAAIL